MRYFAYGSNLDIKRMLKRCPNAVIEGKGYLQGYRLVFQGNNRGKICSNLVEEEGSEVHGVIFDLEKKDIESLNGFEGYPKVYGKYEVKVNSYYGGREVKCFTYIMAQEYTIPEHTVKGYGLVKEEHKVRIYGVPEEEYFGFILDGYKNFGLNKKNLYLAVDFSERMRIQNTKSPFKAVKKGLLKTMKGGC